MLRSDRHDLRYLRFARAISKAATCSRAHVGAVIVLDGRVVSIGYNGAPRGAPHCPTECETYLVDGVKHCKRAVHAEVNAIANAAYVGARTAGGVLYCTHTPCIQCAKLAVNAGIVEIVYYQTYRDLSELSRLCEETGLRLLNRGNLWAEILQSD